MKSRAPRRVSGSTRRHVDYLARNYGLMAGILESRFGWTRRDIRPSYRNRMEALAAETRREA
jgi:hypothetical protein